MEEKALVQTIDAALLKSMIISGAALLESQKQQINELNVFPVPDGDTGTNMSLTLNAGVTALKAGRFDSVTAVADCVASALLRGARGNSGVILSLLFRGVGKSLKEKTTCTAPEFAAALQRGVEVAYKAVMRPTEGTILTVSRLAAEAGVTYGKQGDDFEALLDAMIAAGDEALAHTVEQNPVLKKASVVDAGGKGFQCVLRGMLSAVLGQPLEHVFVDDSQETGADFAGMGDEEITFAFDTVFIVRKSDPDVDLDPFREYLSSIGDSLVIGEDDDAFKVHVHTNTPGDALNAAQQYGTLELAKIENMVTQRDDLAAGRKAQSTDDLAEVEKELEAMEGQSEPVDVPPEKPYGLVAVCAGHGMEAVFKNLGVDALVTGGQTMNPSTEDILRAVQSVPAETVFVLPNNKNIIMAAQQCDRLTEKNVVVIPSKTVPQGISALVCFDDTLDAGDLTEAMTDACGTVHTALVTYAARDSEFDGAEIRAGEYLALLENQLLASTSDLADLIGRISDAVRDFDPEILTVFYGEDVSAEDAETVADKLRAAFPDADTQLISGGQPVYYYMISAE